MRILVLLLLFTSPVYSQHIQEKLGYPAGTKLLIIHADDIGVSHSENEATIEAFEKGIVNSGSIMMPCPWVPEIAAYAATHPQADLGLHLTLTAEWKLYKWGTVVPRNEAVSLVDAKGFFPDNVADFVKNAKFADVEREIRGQIERAKLLGIDFTHFDSHMGTLFSGVEYAKLYIKLGHEYKVPVMISNGLVKSYLGIELRDYTNDKDVPVDNIYMANPPDYKAGMKTFYSGVITGLKPGLSIILIHVAHDDSEMKAVTIDHPDFGAAWRQADFDFFTSEEARKLLKDNNVQLVTWREIRDKITRK